MCICKERCKLRVSEDRVRRKAFRPKRDEVSEEWQTLLSKKTSYFYSLPNNFWMIKL